MPRKQPPLPEAGIGTKVLLAGTAGTIADVATFPLDLAKVRLMIQGEGAVAGVAKPKLGLVAMIRHIFKHEGVKGLYGGVVPGIQRQMAFCGIRVGLYDGTKTFIARKFFPGRCGAADGFGVRVAAGMTTGALAVLGAQPTDVVKIRMQAQRANGKILYTSSFGAYRKIWRTEGMKGLYKGTGPNIARNCIVNVCELVSYDYIKKDLLMKRLGMGDNLITHFSAGTGAGFVTTVIASPVDVIKTRFMNSQPGQYGGVIDCAVKLVRNEGPLALYKGFVPSFSRLGLWNIAMFVTYEQLKKLYKSFQEYEQKHKHHITFTSLKH